VRVLKGQKSLQLAASIAREFKIDPIAVLNSTTFIWQVRLAAFEVVREQKKKEAEQMRSRARRK